jgi:hypothetical protein
MKRTLASPATHLLHRIWHNLTRAATSEAHAWNNALRHPALYGLLLVLVLALLLRTHLPLHYDIDVGSHEQYGGDLPMLRGFNTPERSNHTTYRWTANGATITLPGVGQRPLMLRFDFLPITAQVAEVGPQQIEVWVGGSLFATMPVRQAGMHTTLLVPAHLLHHGTLHITLHTTTFTPPDDPRNLGTPLDYIRISTPTILQPAAPDWRAVVAWLLAFLVLWGLLLRLPGRDKTRALQRWAVGYATVALVLVIIATFLDPPRWAYGAQPALITLLWCYALVLVLRNVLPTLAARLHIPLTAPTLGWLILIIVTAFGLRYGGRIYPDSMDGDIKFHTHRFVEAIQTGNLYLRARNRGVDFPYPPGPYVLLAPATLLHPHPPSLLQAGAALVEATSAALVYTLVVRTLAAPRNRGEVPAHPHETTGLLAAALYVFSAAGIMTAWWSFDTHIFTQATSLLLITTLAWWATATMPGQHITSQRTLWASLTIGVMSAAVFLGHFGFFINTTLLGGVLLLLLWAAAQRSSNQWATTLLWPLALAFVAAGLFAVAFFYSTYIPLFITQAHTVAEGGLPELAQREPVTRDQLWHGIWQTGFVEHFGFFPLALLPVGLWLVGNTRRMAPHNNGPGRQRALTLLALMGSSVLVSSLFAVLPFITLSTQSTRWLMFSAWAVAIGAALAWQALWHRGRVGRVVVSMMAGFVVWNSAVFWLGPLAWRIRPPEPF